MTLLGSAAPAAKLASSATPASTRREQRNIENLDVSVGKLKKAAYCNIFALFPAARRPGAAGADAASATAFLSAADPVLAGLVLAYPGIHLARRSDPFTTLARAIVGQQISVKAAQAIWDRLAAASGAVGTPPRLDPARLCRMRLPALLKVGLSGRKAEYLRDLA